MSVVTSLIAAADCFESVPADARVLRKSRIYVGPGGAWRAGVWYIGFRRLRAVLIPVGSGLPVALAPVFASAQAAADAAESHAAFAAEINADSRIETEDAHYSSEEFIEEKAAVNRQFQ